MSRHVVLITIIILALTGISWGEEIIIKGEPLALTASGETYMAPKWSPDGAKVAVGGGNYSGIYLIDFPSGEMNTLTKETGAGYGLAWAPSGDAIAARVSRYENNMKRSQLVLLYLDGTRHALSEPQRSLPGTPIWSKSGEFVYLKSGKMFQLYMVSSSRSSSLTGELPYLKSFDIYLRDLETGAESKLSNSQERVLHLEISPAETQYAYSTASEDLWIADLDGSNSRKLGRGSVPTWSPDGNWIACMVTEDDGHVFTRSDIHIYNAINGKAQVLTATPDIHEMRPVWSPDGNWIAYENELDGRIWVIQIGRR